VTGGKPIVVWSQSISGVSAVNSLLRHPWKKYRSFILSLTPHETDLHNIKYRIIKSSSYNKIGHHISLPSTTYVFSEYTIKNHLCETKRIALVDLFLVENCILLTVRFLIVLNLEFVEVHSSNFQKPQKACVTSV
jgi:hypothetical protein